MNRIRQPSPAMIVAVLALVAALAGTAVADVATTAKLDKKEKKQVKKIAKKQINKLAPGLSVDHANTADSATNAQNADNANQLGNLQPNGYQLRVRWALVRPSTDLNGAILAQSGGVTLEEGISGFSYLDWGENIGSRAIQVSVASGSAGFVSGQPCGAAPGNGDCNPAFDDANHTQVKMFTSGGAPTNLTYFISVAE
jgi:hypothetical protein